MKKIIFTLFVLSLLCVNSYSQAWEIAAFVLSNKIEKDYNNNLKEKWSPYIDCYEGQTFTFLGTRNTFKRFDYYRKDTGREIDEDKQGPYINKPYFIENIIYDVDDLLGEGVLFVLKDEAGKNIYVQLSYRNIDRNDALARTFKEAPACDSYWRSQVIDKKDKFTETSIRNSPCTRFTLNNLGFIYFSQSLDTDSLYGVTLMVGTNLRDEIAKADCYIIFDDGEKYIYKDCEVYVYDNKCKEDFCLYYCVNLILTNEEIQKFTTNRITDIRLQGIDILDIPLVYGQRVMQSCSALYYY